MRRSSIVPISALTGLTCPVDGERSCSGYDRGTLNDVINRYISCDCATQIAAVVTSELFRVDTL